MFFCLLAGRISNTCTRTNTDTTPTAHHNHRLPRAVTQHNRVPGAKTVSYANAGLLGGCGVIAALVAWLAGLCLILVLLGRWVLRLFV